MSVGSADLNSPALARPRIEGLDALRAICALVVVVFHLETTGLLTNLPFFRHGWMLVDFFFVLSGFVITGAYADKIGQGFSVRRYMVLRFARVWPLHMVLLLCYLMLELSKLVVSLGASAELFAAPREAGAFVMNVALLQVFGLYDHPTWNVPSWSIAAEFWVYLLAALTFKWAGSARWLVLFCLAALCLVALMVWGRPYLNLTYDGSVVRCLYGFSIGSLAHSLLSRHPLPVRGARLMGSALEIAFIAAMIPVISLCEGAATLAIPLLFGCGVFVFAHQAGWLSDVLNARVLVWLGSISYSIYITHAFVVGRLLDVIAFIGGLVGTPVVERVIKDGVSSRVLTGSEPFLTAMVLLTLGVIVAVSYVTHRFIEQPCNRWVRQRLSAHRWPGLSRPRVDQMASPARLENVT